MCRCADEMHTYSQPACEPFPKPAQPSNRAPAHTQHAERSPTPNVIETRKQGSVRPPRTFECKVDIPQSLRGRGAGVQVL